MAFVKLDTGILNSTLWFERDCREVFITALLMAHPIELREPMPQLHVSRIETTGFVVPIGWYGFVPAAGPGIIRMAMCSMDSGTEALVRLGSPDPESRTPDHEGRRMVRVDGGYIILNFIKYREKDNTTKERSARYRDRQRIIASRRDVVSSRRDSPVFVTENHQAEAEAEAEAYIKPTPKTKTARARAIPCPDGVSDGTWSDWLTLRKAKRAPVTETVVREAGIEAGKAGMTLEAFLRVWCSRGSQGLLAEWLKPQERAGPQRESLSKWIKGTSLDPDFKGYPDDIGGLYGNAPALR